MKKILKIYLILLVIMLNKNIYATDINQINTNEIIQEQQQELGISNFIDISKQYTQENLSGIDINQIFNSALTGNVDNTNFFNIIFNTFGKEIKYTISTIRNNYGNNYNS